METKIVDSRDNVGHLYHKIRAAMYQSEYIDLRDKIKERAMQLLDNSDLISKKAWECT